MNNKNFDKSDDLAKRRLGMVELSPELNKLQTDALLAIINDPQKREGKPVEAVELSQDLIDVLRSFVPEDCIGSFINYMMAKMLHNRVIRSNNLRTFHRGNRLQQEYSRWGARIRWENWKKKVEAGEIVPLKKGKDGRRQDFRVMCNEASHRVFMGIARKSERRRIFSGWIARAILAGVPDDAEFKVERCTHSAYMNEEAHTKFLEFAKKLGKPASAVLNYLVSKYGMEMAF